MGHPQHLGDPAASVCLAQVEQIGGEGDGIAAACIGGEVGPAPGLKVDAKAAGVTIVTPWVPGDVLMAAAPAIG